MISLDRQIKLTKEITRFANLHQIILKDILASYPSPESDWSIGLQLFLYGYAFERQGRSPNYSLAAVESISKLRKKYPSKPEKDFAENVWSEFLSILNIPKSGKGANKYNNPLYLGRQSGKKAVTNFLLEIPEYRNNIVYFTLSELKNAKVENVHQRLMTIRGQGNKIIGLFLRDIAIMYNIRGVEKHTMLQPVDVWVRRTVRLLMGEAGDPLDGKQDIDDTQIARNAIHYAIQAEVSPLDFNRASWYFGSQIMKSSLKLSRYFSERYSVEQAVTSRLNQLEKEKEELLKIVGI